MLRVNRGVKTHSSMRQSNLQLQNEAALMSCRIQAIEHRKSTTGLAGTRPCLKNRILPNYTRIENAHKAHKKTFDFLLCIDRPVTSLGHQEGRRVFREGSKFFELCPIFLNLCPTHFSRGAKNYLGELRPPGYGYRSSANF